VEEKGITDKAKAGAKERIEIRFQMPKKDGSAYLGWFFSLA
jgi:hypothetical protein